MINKKTFKIIIEDAVSLQKFNINGLAWKRKDVLKLLNSLLNENIIVLGGDVCEIKENISILAAWSCAKIKNESHQEFAKRSVIESMDYINNYPENNGKFLFTLVFEDGFSCEDLYDRKNEKLVKNLFRTIVHAIAYKISTEKSNWILELLEYDEYDLAYKELCDQLNESKVLISRSLYDQIVKLGEILKVDDSLWKQLKNLIIDG